MSDRQTFWPFDPLPPKLKELSLLSDIDVLTRSLKVTNINKTKSDQKPQLTKKVTKKTKNKK